MPTIWLALILQACSPTSIQTLDPEPTSIVEPTPVTSTEAVIAPTAGPAATIWPPTFDPWSLQDIRQLDSFIVTISEKNTVNGEMTELTHTIGYIKEPYSAYDQNQYTGGVSRIYTVEGWTYELTGSGDWYISAGAKDDLFFKADIPASNTEKLWEAQFVGQEDFQGIPAYHFVLDPVNSTEGNSLEGELFLARDGNYILHSHWKETSSEANFTQIYEVTHSLSSINQLTEIKLPADMQEMAAAVQVPAEMGLPLPENSKLARMVRYKHGIGVDLYYFTKPDLNVDEFLNYYRQLPTTNGWQVTHVGHVNLHEADCEFTRECVIINKGGTQVILHYSGAEIRVEFDWPHLYSPL